MIWFYWVDLPQDLSSHARTMYCDSVVRTTVKVNGEWQKFDTQPTLNPNLSTPNLKYVITSQITTNTKLGANSPMDRSLPPSYMRNTPKIFSLSSREGLQTRSSHWFSRPWDNHVVQIWWRSVQGFSVGWGSNFTIPIDFDGHPCKRQSGSRLPIIPIRVT